MRKITENAAHAFIAGRDWKSGNTEVATATYTVNGSEMTSVGMYLHGNLIARRNEDGFRITLAGWPTPTTKERLNGLLTECGIRDGFWQHKHVMYFGVHGSSQRDVESNEWIQIENA